MKERKSSLKKHLTPIVERVRRGGGKKTQNWFPRVSISHCVEGGHAQKENREVGFQKKKTTGKK